MTRGKWGGGEVGRWGGGEVGRWEVGRWGGGEVGRWGPLDTTAPLVELVRVTVFFNAPARVGSGGLGVWGSVS